MTSNTTNTRIFSAAVILLILSVASQVSWAGNYSDEIPFDKANIFFELNNTDGDLGIHSLIDGEPWKKLVIEDAKERSMLKIKLKGKLRKQGLTELFFESAEPTFDELSHENFFKRFAEGEYTIEGITTEGVEMESTAIVTHVMPAPPKIFVSGQPVSEDCEVDPGPKVSESFTVRWDPITQSHPEIGRTGEFIEVVNYQLVLEREDPLVKYSVELSPDITSVEFPPGLANPGDEFKVEVLVREASGNQTATESCFLIQE